MIDKLKEGMKMEKIIKEIDYDEINNPEQDLKQSSGKKKK